MSTRWLERPGFNMAYRSHGAGDHVILIHALATSQEVWTRQIRDLGAECNVLSFDLRGHGESPAAADADYSFEALASDVVELMDYLGIRQADLIGISVGGEVAQVVAAVYPDRVRRLVLTSTACYTNPARAALWAERATDARRLGMAVVAATTTRRWFSVEFAKLHPEIVSWCEGLVAATPLSTYEAFARVIASMDLRPQIARIRQPTLVICGELDGNTGPATGQILVDHILGARLAVLPRTGHFPNLESPNEFAALCLDFFRSPTPAQATDG